MNLNSDTLTFAALSAALADIDAVNSDLQALYDAADAADAAREDGSDGDPCVKVHAYELNDGTLSRPSMGYFFFFETNDERDAFAKEVNAIAKFSIESGASKFDIAFIEGDEQGAVDDRSLELYDSIDAALSALQDLYDSASKTGINTDNIGDHYQRARIYHYRNIIRDRSQPEAGSYYFFETVDACNAFTFGVNTIANYLIAHGASSFVLAWSE